MAFSPGRDMFGGGKAGELLDPMYMLMGGSGPKGSKLPQELQTKQVERAEDMWRTSKPLVGEGVLQTAHQQRHGTAQGLPIVNDLIQGQQTAMGNTTRAQQEMTKRAGGDASFARAHEQMVQDQNARIAGLGPRIAAPVVSAGMGTALGGPAAAQQAYASAMGAVAPQAPKPNYLGMGASLAQAFGGFGTGGGGGKGAPAATQTASAPWPVYNRDAAFAQLGGMTPGTLIRTEYANP